MKKVSIYVKGGNRAATTYYRFFKYFDRIEAKTVYRKMIPDKIHDRIMPITRHSRLTQVMIFVCIYFRVFFQLIADVFRWPDLIVISRRLLNRAFPLSYKFLLRFQKKRGATIVWDFDDQIVASREVSPSGFKWLCSIADVIIVASPILRDMVALEWREKVLFLPTTDNEPNEKYNSEIEAMRLMSFKNRIELIWLATSVSLPFLREIMPALEIVGNRLRSIGKGLNLSVICNYPLNYEPQFFHIENVKWERDVALQKLMQAHVGLMPLRDSKGTRGKGGFKLIQYISGALPVVGTAIGINASIINGGNGIGVSGLDINEWSEAVLKIVATEDQWRSYSKNALLTWQKNYNYESNLTEWKRIINNV